jgi:4-amino-4-deoxychorismate lyase
MCLLFETIRIENSLPLNLEWHELRMRRSRKELWGMDGNFMIGNMVTIPDEMKAGLIRCNVVYGKTIEKVVFKEYRKHPVRTLRMVDCGDLDYHLKYYDRRRIEILYSQRGNCDEILMVKEGLITDTSISNVIFFDGKHWLTPHRPLLNGTCRQRLLKEGVIHEAEIRIEDLGKYKGLKLINSLRIPREENLISLCAMTGL